MKSISRSRNKSNTRKRPADQSTITVNEIEVQVIRKDIKNLRLAVYPPDGRVRLSVPRPVSDGDARLVIKEKLDWIRKQQARIQAQRRQPPQEVISGEPHYLWGRPYRLEVVARYGRHEVEVMSDGRLRLYVRPGATRAKREMALDNWYRAELKAQVPDLIAKWEPAIGRKVAEWGVKKMKTRWGSCNIQARRIWLNLELAKKPAECLEYVLVHEMVHLLERYHNADFWAHLDRLMPGWRQYRDLLDQGPEPHEAWDY